MNITFTNMITTDGEDLDYKTYLFTYLDSITKTQNYLNKKIIDDLHRKLTTKDLEKVSRLCGEEVEKEILTKYVVKNKSLEHHLEDNYIELSVEGSLQDCGISGRYLAIIKIEDKKNKKHCYKEYICSVTRKEQEADTLIEYVYLNHLEIDEILEDLNKITLGNHFSTIKE